MPDTAVSPAPIPEPSFDDALVFVREHAGDARLTSGELLVEHAAGTARIMQTLNVDPAAIAAAALAIAPHIDDPERVISERFGAEVQSLVADVRKLWRLGSVSSRAAQATLPETGRDAQAARRAQVEALRKMLLSRSRRIFAWC